MDGKRRGKGAVRKIDLDAFFQLAEEFAPFLLLLLPGFGLVGPQHFSEIPWAKDRAPFHTAQGLLHPPGFGVDPMRRVHQGIARHGRLAKNRAPHLIRRNEPPRARCRRIRFCDLRKPPTRTIFHNPKMSRTRYVALL